MDTKPTFKKDTVLVAEPTIQIKFYTVLDRKLLISGRI